MRGHEFWTLELGPSSVVLDQVHEKEINVCECEQGIQQGFSNNY